MKPEPSRSAAAKLSTRPANSRARRAIPALGAALGCLLLALLPTVAEAIFVVNGAWLRPVAAGGSADVYMTLTSTEGATLVGARSEISTRAMLYAAGSGAAVDRLQLPAGKDVALAPDGPRVRLARVNHKLALGDRVSLVLIVEGADGARQEIPVDAEVRRRSALEDHLRGHAH